MMSEERFFIGFCIFVVFLIAGALYGARQEYIEKKACVKRACKIPLEQRKYVEYCACANALCNANICCNGNCVD